MPYLESACNLIVTFIGMAYLQNHDNFIIMPTVKFTYALRRFFPGLKDTPAKGSTLKEVLQEVEG